METIKIKDPKMSVAVKELVRALTSASSGQLAAKIKTLIQTAPVVVFSKSYCSFSGSTKRLFDMLKTPYVAVELDQIPNGSNIQAELTRMTGQTTVPNVFIHQKQIGGNSDVQSLYSSGKLEELLAGSPASASEGENEVPTRG